VYTRLSIESRTFLLINETLTERRYTSAESAETSRAITRGLLGDQNFCASVTADV
jgi:hypothetical protein